MPVTILQTIGGIIGPVIILCGVVLVLGAANDVDWISRFPGYRPSFHRLARVCIGIIGVVLAFAGMFLAAQDFLRAVFFH